jgi:predicted HTH transcriptional regulator
MVARKLPNIRFNIHVETVDNKWVGDVELTHRARPDRIVRTFFEGTSFARLSVQMRKAMTLALNNLKDGKYE